MELKFYHVLVLLFIPLSAIFTYLIEKVEVKNEELKKSNTLKDLFIDIMRHDLLNPATAIKFASEILQQEEKDPEKKELVQRIDGSNSRIIEMIENASIIATLESGDVPKFTELNMCVVLKNSIDEVRHLADNKNINIIYDEKPIFKVMVNPLIYNVFINLLDNAIKYSKKGSDIKVSIEPENLDFTICIADNGEGVLDKDKKGIFTRFERVNKEGVKGSGLGLAIVQKIVELHNGHVWVEDNLVGGSIFCINLPTNNKI